jgi:replicative DNA helicase
MNDIHKHFIAQVLLKPSILSLSAITSTHFLNLRDRHIFKAIEEVSFQGQDVNVDSVAKKAGWKISEVLDYNYSVGTANWEYFQGEIIEAYRREVVLKAANKIIQNGKSLSADDMLEEIAQATTSVQIKTLNRVKRGDEIFSEALDRFKERSLGKKQQYISTGIQKLDDIFGGFKPRRLYYVGARPSQGKSALLMNFATNTLEKGMFFTAESSGEELIDRIIVRKGGFNSKKFQQGLLTTEEEDRLHKMKRLENLFIYYDGDLNIHKISSIAHNYKRIHEIKIIFIDYLQLIRPKNLSIPRNEQVAEMSIRLKQLANDVVP